MKVHKVNPNCSEIVVRLGDLQQGSPIQDVRDEIKSILDCTSVKLAIKKTDWASDNRKIYTWDVPVEDVMYQNDEDEGETIGAKGMGTRGKIVRDLEIPGWYSLVLYLPGNDPKTKYDNNSVSITYSGFGPEMVLSISDCDRYQFPIIAEVIRAMNYVWSPHDGGHADSFENWCDSNGYSDVARMRW